MEGWNKQVKLVRTLKDDHELKLATFECDVESENGEKQTAVLILEKTPFTFDDVEKLIKSDEQVFKTDFINDVYHKYTVEARTVCNDIKLQYVYPATPLHLKKYSQPTFHLVVETHQVYETIVRPFIENNQLDPQWVYNVLDGKAERDRIILETDEFVVLPNITYDGKSIESLHVLVLTKSRSIRSIRDLKPEHLPLLESILDQTTDVISSKYSISKRVIRAYFHYPPSFYSLHVHFTALQYQTGGCEVERAHLLQNVIDHIKMQGDYYQKKTLYYKVSITDPLYKLIEDAEQGHAK